MSGYDPLKKKFSISSKLSLKSLENLASSCALPSIKKFLSFKKNLLIVPPPNKKINLQLRGTKRKNTVNMKIQEDMLNFLCNDNYNYYQNNNKNYISNSN